MSRRARRRRDRESGQAMVEFALILFPLLIVVGGDHPVRDRAELLARHAAHREPGCALGGRQQLAAGVSRAETTARAPHAGMHREPTHGDDAQKTLNARFDECLRGSAGVRSAIRTRRARRRSDIGWRSLAPYSFVLILGIGTITLAPTQRCGSSSGRPASRASTPTAP